MARTYLILPPHLRDKTEFLIVDNGSPGSDHAELVAFHWPPGMEVKVVASGRNGGFGFGCNTGYRHAAGAILFFLNSDAWLTQTDGLDYALDTATHGGAAIVFPLVREPNGNPLPNGTPVPSFSDMLLRSFKIGALFRRILGPRVLKSLGRFIRHSYLRAFSSGDVTTPFYVEVGSGAAFFISKERFAALGTFDEDFFLYDEDADLFARSCSKGWRHLVVPTLVVETVNGSTTRKLTPLKLKAIKKHSRTLYIRKHFSGVQRLILLAVNEVAWILY